MPRADQAGLGRRGHAAGVVIVPVRLPLGNVVDAPRVPGMTPREPPHRQPTTPQRTEPLKRGDGIRRAGRVEAALLWQQRRHRELIDPHEHEQRRRRDLAPRPWPGEPRPEQLPPRHGPAHATFATARPGTGPPRPRGRRSQPSRPPAPPARQGHSRPVCRPAAQRPGPAAAGSPGCARRRHPPPRTRRNRPGAHERPSDRSSLHGPRSTARRLATHRGLAARRGTGPTHAAGCGPGAHGRLRRTARSGPCPARGEDRPTGARAHPQAEAVRLGTTAVVRLEGALAHGSGLRRSAGPGRVACGRSAVDCGSPVCRAPPSAGRNRKPVMTSRARESGRSQGRHMGRLPG
jgi:hypothetical protein